MAEVYLTSEGKKQLEEKLAYYKTVKRKEVIEAIGIAREYGDLSENSEYDHAKEEQGKLEAEIAEMEATLREAKIIVKTKTGKVSLGSKVKVYDEEYDETVIYKLVGSTESDPMRGFISNESPVGKALLGKEKGDVVVFETPTGNSTLKILDVN